MHETENANIAGFDRAFAVILSDAEGYTMSYLERITFNPEQCGGRPCIRGMRIRVKDVLDLLAAGASADEILQDYPDLEAEDIKACLQYAAAQANHAVLRVLNERRNSARLESVSNPASAICSNG
jgi:uncharacterized protein (DUF433 family)